MVSALIIIQSKYKSALKTFIDALCPSVEISNHDLNHYATPDKYIHLSMKFAFVLIRAKLCAYQRIVFKNKFVGAGEMVHYLTASTTLVEDPNMVPGIHILQFTMASDSGSRGLDSSSNLHRYLQ